MIKRTFITLILFLIIVDAFAQDNINLMEARFPKIITPNVYEFIKYGNMPVNEYNGLANISVPIFNIEEKSFDLPISLKYYAGGIKVAEQASWVGLGWDLQLGSIVQIVNDRDDMDNSFVKILPDYIFSPNYAYLMPYYEHFTMNPLPAYTASSGISQSNPQHSYAIFTNAFVPVNNTYDYTKYPEIVNEAGATRNPPDNTDTEPDIFKVNFLDHSVSFIIDWASGDPIPLDTKYKIEANTTGGWKVIAPDGIQADFEEENETTTDFWTNTFRNVDNPNLGGSDGFEGNTLKSRIWLLTKIVGINGEEVNLAYAKIENINNLREYNHELTYKETSFYYQEVDCGTYTESIRDFNSPSSINNYYKESSFYSKSFLSSISFSKGSIHFTLSDRDDIGGEKRLDSINIYNTNSVLVKSFSLGYDYFTGHTNGNSFENETNDPATLNELTKRLKLTQIQEAGQPPYILTYNSTNLPKKTSYATDVWGYYNGKLQNTSMLPNPVRLGYSQFPDNGNNKSADLTYAKAGILEEIQYPSGGTSFFEYELNEFEVDIYDDKVPDFDQNINTTNHIKGNGLRIKSITNYNYSLFASKKEYLYSDGISPNPLKLVTLFEFKTLENSIIPGPASLNKVEAAQISSSNYFTPSILGSGNSIGYSSVEVRQLDSGNNANGKIINYYYNNRDIFQSTEYDAIKIPAFKKPNVPENGSLWKNEIYNSDNILVQQTENQYNYIMSSVYYGAKIGRYGMAFMDVSFFCDREIFEQDIAGYYPIFSGENLLQWSTVTDYLPTEVIKTTNFTYNNLGIVKTIDYTSSKGEIIKQEFKYLTDYNSNITINPVLSAMRSMNMVNHKIEAFEWVNNKIVSAEFYKYDYTSSPKLKQNYKIETSTPLAPSEYTGLDAYGNLAASTDYKLKTTVINYDTHGNPLNIETKDGILTTYTWDTTGQYPLTKTISKGAISLSESWTWKPLVGMLSHTDQGGLTFTYEYDDFGRLKLVKDPNGNILNYYEYHYKTQN